MLNVITIGALSPPSPHFFENSMFPGTASVVRSQIPRNLPTMLRHVLGNAFETNQNMSGLGTKEKLINAFFHASERQSICDNVMPRIAFYSLHLRMERMIKGKSYFVFGKCFLSFTKLTTRYASYGIFRSSNYNDGL